jgi:hypothetical protein
MGPSIITGRWLNLRHVLPCIAFSLMAAPVASTADSVSTADATRIAQMMKAQFDQAGMPLEVNPVTVAGAYAIAGWTKGDTGGRALLQRMGANWEIVLCAGDALLRSNTLVAAGVAPDAAARLLAGVSRAEASLTAARREKLSRFATIVRARQVHP